MATFDNWEEPPVTSRKKGTGSLLPLSMDTKVPRSLRHLPYRSNQPFRCRPQRLKNLPNQLGKLPEHLQHRAGFGVLKREICCRSLPFSLSSSFFIYLSSILRLSFKAVPHSISLPRLLESTASELRFCFSLFGHPPSHFLSPRPPINTPPSPPEPYD